MPESRRAARAWRNAGPPWLPPLALKGRDDHWHRPPDCARGGPCSSSRPAGRFDLLEVRRAVPQHDVGRARAPPPARRLASRQPKRHRRPPSCRPCRGRHGAGIIVRPCAGSARPFASSCGGGPCSSSAKRTEPTRTRTRRPLQECAGPRLMVSCDGVVSSPTLAAHAVRDLPAAEDPAGQVQRLRDRFGRMPCRPARNSRKNASCSPRKSTSARRPSGPFRAGRRACSSSTCGRGIGARGRFSALPPARTPMTRPPQGVRSAARARIPDGGEPEPGARAERRFWRRGCDAPFVAPFGFQAPPARRPFRTPPRCPTPTRSIPQPPFWRPAPSLLAA